MKDIYFPGLNGIRAIAAMIVLLFHIDQYTTQYFDFADMGIWKPGMQKYAVVLFFVLSGFLITYILLAEKQKDSKINYRNFYLRRILRIWPVYYLVLVVGLILLLIFKDEIYALPKNNDLGTTFLFYTFLLSNIGFALRYRADLIGNLWSIGVEEQFYAVWPLLVNKVKNIPGFLFVLLLFYLGLKFLLVYGIETSVEFDYHIEFVPFDHMMVGGLGACLFFYRSRLLRIVYNKIIQLFCWVFFLYSVFVTPVRFDVLGIYNWNVHALVYVVIILNVATNPSPLISLENNVFNFFGRISYGIYAYHGIVFFLMTFLLKEVFVFIGNDEVKRMILYFTVVSSTILLAYLSYKYFESWFLTLKKRFMTVRTTS